MLLGVFAMKRQKLSIKNIVSKYIEDFEANNFHNSNAIATLDSLIRIDPKKAWRIIINLTKSTSNESLLAFIAAGPIEDLLVRHPEMIDQIEHDALKNMKVCEILDCVWKNKMSNETWEKLQRILDKHWEKQNLEMQNMLKKHGYDVEDNGRIGPKTMKAINQLRNKTGLYLKSVEEIIEQLKKMDNNL